MKPTANFYYFKHYKKFGSSLKERKCSHLTSLSATVCTQLLDIDPRENKC